MCRTSIGALGEKEPGGNRKPMKRAGRDQQSVTQNSKAIEVAAALRCCPGIEGCMSEERHLDSARDIGTQDGDSHLSAVVGLELRFQGVEEMR